MCMSITSNPFYRIIKFISVLFNNILQSPCTISITMWIINRGVQLTKINFFMNYISLIIYYLLSHLFFQIVVGIMLRMCENIINYQLKFEKLEKFTGEERFEYRWKFLVKIIMIFFNIYNLLRLSLYFPR